MYIKSIYIYIFVENNKFKNENILEIVLCKRFMDGA